MLTTPIRINVDRSYDIPAPNKIREDRVIDRVEPPLTCRYDAGTVLLTHNESVYGVAKGDWPYVYCCQSCGARVGTHPYTWFPLGYLADAPLRQTRMANKAHFIKLMRMVKWDQHRAYTWLALALGIPKAECHWAMFEIDMCIQAGKLCIEAMQAAYAGKFNG